MRFFIYVRNKPVTVSEEIYRTYRSMKRRERYLKEKDKQNDLVSYSSLDTSETLGEEMIPSGRITKPVEEEVLDKFLHVQLYASIAMLDEYEQSLIRSIFFEEKTQMQLSAEMGIPQCTISRHTSKVLKKLRILLEE